MRKSTSGSGFLIQDDYPPGSPTALGQAVAVPQAKPALNERVSNWLSWLSFALVVASPVCLAWMWGYAWRHHLAESWGESQALQVAWAWSVLLSGGAFFSGAAALLFKVNLRALVTISLSIVFGFIALGHLCLILYGSF